MPPAVRKGLAGARRFAKTGHGFPFSFCPKTDTVFWPGCGLAANRPGLVRRVRNILSNRLHKRVGLALDCCFDPVFGLGDTETAFAALREIGNRLGDRGVRKVITGCLNCNKLLSERLEGIRVVFVLEVLMPEDFGIQPMDPIYLHHPCPSTRWKEIPERAVALVRAVHPSPGGEDGPAPLPGESPSTQDLPAPVAASGLCCGAGGGLGALDAGLADLFLDRIVKAAAGKTIATYCTGCQNRLIGRGVKAVHLLERLPGRKPNGKIPSPFRQWIGRFMLTIVERLNDLHVSRRIGKGSPAEGDDQK